MFAYGADEVAEPSTLERFTAFTKRLATKGTKAIEQAKTIKSAATDIRKAVKPVSAQDAANIELANRGMADEIFGMPSTYVYVGVGLLIAAGVGYIAYNRLK